jgi:hypothetical protein
LNGTPKRFGKCKVGNRPLGGYVGVLADSGIAKMHRQRKVDNRPPGGCVGVLADSGIAKMHRKNQNALRFGR